MKCVISFSGGKDSVLALDRAVRAGHMPVALLSMYKPSAGRTWTHGMDEPLLKALSDALSLPLILCKTEGEDYEPAFVEGLLKAKAMGAEACVFGDIDIEAHRAWDEQRCVSAGLSPLLPLWGCGREEAVRETLSRGYRCIIKCVRRGVLPPDMPGRELSPELLGEIAALGADICGENGEYHTVVTDGPLFKKPVELKFRGIAELEYIYAADLAL